METGGAKQKAQRGSDAGPGFVGQGWTSIVYPRQSYVAEIFWTIASTLLSSSIQDSMVGPRPRLREINLGFLETTCQMLSQATCTWPRFPKEWQSDSGLGEPEDRRRRPVP